MRVIWLSFATLALLPVSAAGCGRSSKTQRADRPLEIVVPVDAETLDPRYAVDAVGLRATRLIHAGLVRLDPQTLKPVPYLARAWEWVDAKTLRVELKSGLRFHSGAPFEANDVVATLHAFADPHVASRHARIVEPIAEVHAESTTMVVITLKRPHATLLTDLELPILRADQAASAPSADGKLDGLGPYRLTHFERGEIDLAPVAVILPAPAHAVTIRTVHDENARALRLLAGDADIEQNVISPTLLPSLENRDGSTIVSRPGANLTYAMFRTDRAPFQDAAMRRAFSSSIDRNQVTRTLLANRAQPASTLLPPTLWAHSDAPQIPFVPVAPPNHVRVTLLTSTDRLRVTIARFIAQEMNDAGWNIEVVPLELGAMIARLNAGDFDAALLQIPELAEPNTLRVFMHSTYIPPAGANRARISDPEIDALLDAGDRETNPAARKKIYADLEAKNRDALYLVPLWHEDQVAVLSARATDFQPSAEGRWLGVAVVR
ncbi:MAG: ABC transporter substrate-binding protein [Polyangiaceae bacterium]